MVHDMNRSDTDAALKMELLRLRLAISSAIDTWAIVEHELSALLQILINDDNGIVGSAIYYAPSNTETRIRIVDTAVGAAIFYRHYGQAVVECWKKVLVRIQRAKRPRNKIAHWYTSEVTVNGSGPFIRLVDPVRRPGHLAARDCSGQIPGMSANDIELYVARLNRRLVDVREFKDVVRAFLAIEPSWEGQQPFLERFHTLADRLKVAAKPEALTWPPKPKNYGIYENNP